MTIEQARLILRPIEPAGLKTGQQMHQSHQRAKQHRFIAHVTPRDGVVRQMPIEAANRDQALARALMIAVRVYGPGITCSVREAL